MLGYVIVGLALFVFVQARNVYPQLLFARLFFSIGGAATSTMVTAVLPSMVAPRKNLVSDIIVTDSSNNGHAVLLSISSELTVTQQRHQHRIAENIENPRRSTAHASPSRLAGFVGLFTGCGALLALGLFLPLPALLRQNGASPGPAVAFSFYIVGAVALVIAVLCMIGLRDLEEGELEDQDNRSASSKQRTISFRLLLDAILLGFTDTDLALAYFGGFVARASSVGISLFIPLYVNAYFVSSGLCKKSVDTPEAVREQCRRAYILAAQLSGVSQLVALFFAPIFGYTSDRSSLSQMPLLVAALIGVVGYTGLAVLNSPDPDESGSFRVFFIMALLGISQVGAIVGSLGLLGRCVVDDRGVRPGPKPSLRDSRIENAGSDENATETSNLLRNVSVPALTRKHLKGSIAGVYSLTGGAAILLLTKLGGYLFDISSPSAPFLMLSAFNGSLLLVGLGCYLAGTLRAR